MPKEFDMKKFITENRVTYPVVGIPAIGRPIHRSPHESPQNEEVLTEDTMKWVNRAAGYMHDANEALEAAIKETKSGGSPKAYHQLTRIRENLKKLIQNMEPINIGL